MAQTEVVIDGDLYVRAAVDGEFGVYIRAGEESPVDEPYGVWTDLVAKYLGRNPENGYGYFTLGKDLDYKGDVVSGVQAVCESYLPVSPGYRYVKSNHRLTKLTCYDENWRVITQDTSNRYDNLTWGIELQIPVGTKYIRFCTNQVSSNWFLQVIRTE